MNYFILVSSLLVSSTTSWSTTTPSNGQSAGAFVSRRQALAQAITAAGTAAVVLSQPAWAGEAGDNEARVTTRMGGLLEPFADSARGIRIMAPSGWNKFDGEVGAYDIKWQDLVDPTENIKISSSPVKSTTESIDALGPVAELGPKLAAKRNAKLLDASARETEGILFYTFDFALSDNTHQLLLLCVCKGKLWSLDANAKEKRWSKREEMYKNVLASFVPRLNPAY